MTERIYLKIPKGTVVLERPLESAMYVSDPFCKSTEQDQKDFLVQWLRLEDPGTIVVLSEEEYRQEKGPLPHMDDLTRENEEIRAQRWLEANKGKYPEGDGW